MRDLVIGSRGSQLALWQSEHVSARLKKAHPGLSVRIEVIKTLGDKILDAPLSKVGEKGLFTKELEKALLEESIDLAVHSLKDLPTNLPEGCAIGAISEREDPSDVFIVHPSRKVSRLSDIPPGGVIATGSLRRTSQLLAQRPDLLVQDLRGNLNTRMKKLEESTWAGILLARAGVKRLGWEASITQVLPMSFMLPAVGQGALGVEVRVDDSDMLALLAPIHHHATASAVLAERAFLRRVEGGCQVPIGTHAYLQDARLVLDAYIGSLDGQRSLRSSASGTADDPDSLGISLAEMMLSEGGREILDEVRSSGDDAREISP